MAALEAQLERMAGGESDGDGLLLVLNAAVADMVAAMTRSVARSIVVVGGDKLPVRAYDRGHDVRSSSRLSITSASRWRALTFGVAGATLQSKRAIKTHPPTKLRGCVKTLL